MNWTMHLIPTDPFFRPSENAVQTALTRLQAYFTHHENITYSLSNKLSFWCAGENFDRVICMHCQSNIFEWFTSTVLKETEGFNDLPLTLPCCGVKDSLLRLSFEDDCGFACFGISICEGLHDAGNTNEINSEELHELETTLGCQLRVIWSGH